MKKILTWCVDCNIELSSNELYGSLKHPYCQKCYFKNFDGKFENWNRSFITAHY